MNARLSQGLVEGMNEASLLVDWTRVKQDLRVSSPARAATAGLANS
jgi:hypothetical protein